MRAVMCRAWCPFEEMLVEEVPSPEIRPGTVRVEVHAAAGSLDRARPLRAREIERVEVSTFQHGAPGPGAPCLRSARPRHVDVSMPEGAHRACLHVSILVIADSHEVSQLTRSANLGHDNDETIGPGPRCSLFVGER